MNHTNDHFAARARGFLGKGKLDLEHASVLRFFQGVRCEAFPNLLLWQRFHLNVSRSQRRSHYPLKLGRRLAVIGHRF